MRGFYWLVEGELAGCSRPGSERGRDDCGANADALEADLDWLRDRASGRC